MCLLFVLSAELLCLLGQRGAQLIHFCSSTSSFMYYTYDDLHDFTLIGACCVVILHSHVVKKKKSFFKETMKITCSDKFCLQWQR